MKNKNGITLIALVITIIVLLILAGVSISLVLGDNGVLTQAKTAAEKSQTSTAEEEIAMAWGSLESDYWSAWANNSSTTRGSIFTKANIEKYLKGTVDTFTYNEDGTGNITYKSSSSNKTNSEKFVIDVNGKVTAVGQGNGSQTKEVAGVDFGNKTASTVVTGDTIRIGTDTENRFMVLTNDGSTIMAIPYYNITLDTTNPVQSSSAEPLAFVDSGQPYWSSEENIDMTNTENNIQPYITAYSNKLKGLTNNKVTAEVGRYYEYNNLSGFNGQSNSESKKLLNPSGIGQYWIGSSPTDRYAVWIVDTEGTFNWWSDWFNFPDPWGVRPVIFISLS